MSPQVLHSAGALHAVASDIEDLEHISTELLAQLSFAAPQASASCKALVRHAQPDTEDFDLFSGHVFNAMLAKGSESDFGLAQFRRGTGNIIWEDLVPRK
ncbi:hypothetical protein ColLi_10763 [Colletotrichum liriopes]|uniref:Uncharacterized protein n=1 Tax=Colletotrichum liriopes TaxID=708192 RepID=A0AA37LWH7_9PEZI|nr:hypothetical protein ColLi_10763 [Colletotrichum liriopes]